jgi:hypothetical protein
VALVRTARRPEVTREDVNTIMITFMRLGANIEELRKLLEDDDGQAIGRA